MSTRQFDAGEPARSTPTTTPVLFSALPSTLTAHVDSCFPFIGLVPRIFPLHFLDLRLVTTYVRTLSHPLIGRKIQGFPTENQKLQFFQLIIYQQWESFTTRPNIVIILIEEIYIFTIKTIIINLVIYDVANTASFDVLPRHFTPTLPVDLYTT